MSVIQMPARALGGALSPIGIVIHCGETPLAAGVATGGGGAGWFQNPASGTSAHRYFDPANSVQMVPLNRVAYHVGPAGNGRYLGYEHAGRAAFTREQWLSVEGMAMLHLSAAQAAADALACSIPRRWLSLTQVARGERGFLTHNDVRLALGGTTHSDIGAGFPYDVYMLLVQQYAGDLQAPAPITQALTRAALSGEDMSYLAQFGGAIYWTNGFVHRNVGPGQVGKFQFLARRLAKYTGPLDVAGDPGEIIGIDDRALLGVGVGGADGTAA